MRTALCLYGQPRDAHAKVHDIVRNVIVPNQCDVFFHAWYDAENLSLNKMTPGHENRMIPLGMDQFLIQQYSPKSFNFEKQRKFFHRNFEASDENIAACWSYSNVYDRQTFVSHKASAIHSMWFSIMNVMLMKDLYSHENGFQYDAVILSRFDVSPTSPVNVFDYDLSNVVTRNYELPRGEVSDWFLFSNDKNMNVIGGTYHSLANLYDSIKKSDCDVWTNEAFIRDILARNNITNVRGNFDVSF